jgi:hypothetical protein
MPLQATSGAASYDAFGGGVPVVPNYIEEVFSTYLYTGTNAQQTITNGIDLSTKGGLIWAKSRSDSTNHKLFDSAQAGTATNWDYSLTSNSTAASTYYAQVPILAQTTGFRINSPDSASINESGYTYVSWTFRKQPKFFDVVTYTGNGIGPRAIPHNLGSAPGCIIVKKTSATEAWTVYHRSVGTSQYLILNGTNAAISSSVWGDTTPTSTNFYVSDTQDTNGTGATYVAYLFAHNAGGFGLTGTDNVISCGSYTGDDTSNRAITLGYEPQWILWKSSSYPSGGSATNWQIYDNMRGWLGNATGTGADSRYLVPNTSSAEAGENAIAITPTGFTVGKTLGGLTNKSGDTYIYIAIRRSPMKVPTVGTSVFALGGSAVTGSSTLTTSFAVDAFIQNSLTSSAANSRFASRLQGSDKRLVTSNTDAEAADNGDSQFNGASYTVVGAGGGVVFGFGRAPSFFDEVCYSPPSSSVNTYSHNLGVIPELMIIKTRDSARRWVVYTQTTGNTQALHLNTNDAVNSTGNNYFNSTSPTASVFTLDNGFADVCNGGGLGVAYLFATCAGVSKVGSYTGNGSTQTINCGFTGGARFVLIKRTDSTGDWMVSDSARGIVSGNDPYLELNNTNAQVTGEDWLDTNSTGFVVNEVSGSNANTSSATYIFLAIA